MAITGGTDQLQRNIVGKNHTITDLGQPLAQRGDIVALGNGSSATGVHGTCVGYNANDNGRDHVTILGPDNTVESEEGVVVGYLIDARADHTVAVGSNLTITDPGGTDRAVMVGSLLNTSGNTVINVGVLNTIAQDAENVTIVGVSCKTGVDADSSIVLGYGLDFTTAAAMSKVMAFGTNLVVGRPNPSNLLIAGDSISVGNAVAGAAATYCLLEGFGITVGEASSNINALGRTLTIPASSSLNTVVGQNIVYSASITNSISLGSYLDSGGGSHQIALCVGDSGGHDVIESLGDHQILLSTGGASRFGSTATNIIGVGYAIKVGLVPVVAAIDRVVAIGTTLTITNPAANRVIMIGADNTILDHATGAIIAGHSISIANQCDYLTAIANFSTIGTNNHRSVAIGYNTNLEADCLDSVLVGSSSTIRASSNSSTGVGVNVQIGLGAIYATSVGQSSAVAAGCTNGTSVGHAAIVSGASGSAFGSGASVTGIAGLALGSQADAAAHQCAIGSKLAAYEITDLVIRANVTGDVWFEAYSAVTGVNVGLKLWDGSALWQVKAEVTPPVGARLLYILS